MLAEAVSRDSARAALGTELRNSLGTQRRLGPRRTQGLLARGGSVAALEDEQHHTGDEAGQRQPAAGRVQIALAFYARSRIERRDGITAGWEIGVRREKHNGEHHRGDNCLGKGRRFRKRDLHWLAFRRSGRA